MDRNKAIIFGALGGIVLIIILIVFGLFSGGTEEDPRLSLEAELDFWGVFDENFAYETAIDDFKNTYPKVEINYRRFNSIESYERTLLNALASGEGPDIFMIRNNDLARKIDKITPIPTDKYSVVDLRSQFPRIVEDNLVFNNYVFGLPLSIDTLSLIYNEDIFGEKNIVFPPGNWSDFQETVSKITEFNQSNQITLSGAAIGGSSNVNRAKDILSLMMIQRGAPMVSEDYTRADFSISGTPNPLAFYASFGIKDSDNYTWNSNMPNSLQAFKNGDVAMILDYHSALSNIRDEEPFLNVDVAPTPQFTGSNRTLSYAHYWAYTVSKQSDLPNVAWDFVVNMTADVSNARGYLNATEKPPALSSIVQEYLNDPDMNVYASQILTARSWAEPDPERVTEIFNGMINTAVNEDTFPQSILSRGQLDVTNIIREL